MRALRYLALVSILLFPATFAHSEVRIGIGIGVPAYGYYAPPACAYGYYGYYPYACAPYGYYGPTWFANGVFIGAGPWYHRAWAYRPYYRPYYRHYYRPYYGYRGYSRDRYYGRGNYHFNGHRGHWDNGWHGRR